MKNVPGAWYLVLRNQYFRRTKNQEPSTKHQAPSTKHQAPSTKHQAPRTKHQQHSQFFILNSSSFQRGVIVMTLPVPTEEKDRKLFWRRVKILCFAGLVCIRLATCARHKPVEEIVTINAGRPMVTEPIPASLESQPLQGSPQFSAIELIGDYLAETTVYLQEEQRLEALTTLAKAEQVTRQMMDDTQTKGSFDVSLRTIIQEQEQAERQIRGGNIEAALLNLGHLSQSLNQLESSMLADRQNLLPAAISVSRK